MKCFHLRRVLHALTDSQKANRARYAQEMIKALGNHSRTGLKYLSTGEESSMTYDQGPTRMWALDWSCTDERVHLTNDSQKTMITVFFAVDGIILLDVLPTGTKLTSDYFCYNSIEALKQVVYLDGRVPDTIPCGLHVDKHPSMRLKTLNKNSMGASSADRNIHPIPQTSLHVTSFFSVICIRKCNSCVMALWKSFKGHNGHGEGIPKAKLTQVFQAWRWRLEKCIQQQGDHFESTESTAVNSICFSLWELG
jgi:hypothetical protein